MVFRRNRKGIALLMSMIVLAVLSAWAVAVHSFSGTTVQLANNQRKVDSALAAAESGIDCGRYLIIKSIDPCLPSTSTNTVTTAQANTVWTMLCSKVPSFAGQTVPAATRFTDTISGRSGDQLLIPAISYGATGTTFAIRFYRYDDTPLTIKLESTGMSGAVAKKVTINMSITKESKVLNYAIAGRGRMWITGNSTIRGPIFSSWNRTDISPFNMTSDSRVESIVDSSGHVTLGTINTILTKQQIQNAGAYQLETLDADGNPMFDQSGNRIYSSEDQIQGYHEGINYGQPDNAHMPGMNINDYDTSQYRSATAVIAASSQTRTEYFPHADGNYTLPQNSGSRRLTRYVYENQTFTNTRVPSNKNALFRNCTFDGILYVDCGTSGTGNYNNVRFQDCTFRGPIVTNTLHYSSSDSTTWWMKNNLYFTGTETFQNETDVPATILAPNFNVNLGNTNPVQGEDNVLTGAIVGGIVDVRGNAQIYGTIISMYDTSSYSSGYVTNIGATLGDGGSETTDAGDVGVISIAPDADKMLPNGVNTPITIEPQQSTYSEGF